MVQRKKMNSIGNHLDKSIDAVFIFDKGSSLSCDGQFLHHRFWRAGHILACQCLFLTNGPAFHVTAKFYIFGFLMGWSYFSMSFDWLTAKVDCDRLSFGMGRVQKETLHWRDTVRFYCLTTIINLYNHKKIYTWNL